MMQFYDLDAGGSLSYNEFMKFILPCDNTDLRAECCQRKTNHGTKASVAGKRLHESVEKSLTEFFEREIDAHIKIEMLKRVLSHQPDWSTKAAFKIIDSQEQGYISHPQIYSFMNALGCDATDEELVAIVRRIDSSGDGSLQYFEFQVLCSPVIVKNIDIQEVED